MITVISDNIKGLVALNTIKPLETFVIENSSLIYINVFSQSIDHYYCLNTCTSDKLSPNTLVRLIDLEITWKFRS